jgi:hypothetical protein
MREWNRFLRKIDASARLLLVADATAEAIGVAPTSLGLLYKLAGELYNRALLSSLLFQWLASHDDTKRNISV